MQKLNNYLRSVFGLDLYSCDNDNRKTSREITAVAENKQIVESAVDLSPAGSVDNRQHTFTRFQVIFCAGCELSKMKEISVFTIQPVPSSKLAPPAPPPHPQASVSPPPLGCGGSQIGRPERKHGTLYTVYSVEGAKRVDIGKGA